MDTFIGTASQQELKDLVRDLNKLILEEWDSHRIWHFNGYRWLDELIELSSYQPFGRAYKRRCRRVEFLLEELFKETYSTRLDQQYEIEIHEQLHAKAPFRRAIIRWCPWRHIQW